jgi:hypothetical protein
MRHFPSMLTLLLLATATLAYAADVRPGDQVRLIERDQHIPVHPAPGDPRVHLRDLFRYRGESPEGGFVLTLGGPSKS